ncbi:MAG: PEP-CTERM sorting domain-containing protein [Pseudomonadales bacterium]
MLKKIVAPVVVGALMSFSANVSAGVVGVFGDGPYGVGPGQINNFYDGLVDHSSSVLGEISDASLSGLDLLWANQPVNGYTGSQLGAMVNYIGNGGRIAFMGEHGQLAPTVNNNINDALEALGAGVRIQNNILDPGFRTASVADGQIQDNPLTEGVETYRYAAYAELIPGLNTQALMLGEDDPTSVMMAFENVGFGSIFLITDQNVWDSNVHPGFGNARMFENLIEGDTGAPPIDPPPVGVPAPAPIGLLLLGMGALALRRKIA